MNVIFCLSFTYPSIYYCTIVIALFSHFQKGHTKIFLMNFHISQTKCNLHCPQLMMRKCVQCIVVCFILFINSVHIQVYTPVLIRRRLRSKPLSIGLDISSHQKDIRRTSDDRFCQISSPPNALQKMLRHQNTVHQNAPQKKFMYRPSRRQVNPEHNFKSVDQGR